MFQIYNNTEIIYISKFNQFWQNEISNSLEKKLWFATNFSTKNNICNYILAANDII